MYPGRVHGSVTIHTRRVLFTISVTVHNGRILFAESATVYNRRVLFTEFVTVMATVTCEREADIQE